MGHRQTIIEMINIISTKSFFSFEVEDGVDVVKTDLSDNVAISASPMLTPDAG